MLKGVATHTIFLIAIITLFLVFTIIGLWYFIGQVQIEANEATCAEKFYNYCMRWKIDGDDPGDWDNVNPQGCENFNINRPSTFEECKNII
ncbi:MAG: hypothetical protein QXY45_00220 [Candidatus Aenigmatarchaeota archaeon]